MSEYDSKKWKMKGDFEGKGGEGGRAETWQEILHLSTQQLTHLDDKQQRK